MPSPAFPDVPMTQGVPPVTRDDTNPGGGTEPLLTRDSDSVTRLASSQWGVFDDGGAMVLQPDNIAGFSYNTEFRIADYPLEKGGFESYNKVATPFETRVTMSKGGKLSDRQAFLRKLERLRSDLNLYSVVTPEATYRNVNIERVSLDRSAQAGAAMLTVEVHLREIRQTATIQFSNSKEPGGADMVDDGSVQTKPSTQTGSDVQ